jgi:murein DD-endopeptidase MepM/ murein hydrolase activator NlpD
LRQVLDIESTSTKVRKMHNGMDFTANTGAPIYATGDGVVERADNTASGLETMS